MANIEIFEFNEGLTKGLRNKSTNRRNTEFATVCKNCNINENGLYTFTPLTDGPGTNALLGSGVSPSNPDFDIDTYPMPMLFVGREVMILHGCDADASNQYLFEPTYSATNGWDNLGINSDDLDIKDALNISNSYSLDTTSPGDDTIFHFIDLGKVWGLIRPTDTVFKSMAGSMHGGSDVYQGQDEVTIHTGTAFKGRVILGGFDSSNFWNDDWKYFFRAWGMSQNMGVKLPGDDWQIGGNYVMWTAVGAGDLPFLFKVGSGGYDYGPTGYEQTMPTSNQQTTPAEPIMFDVFERNEFGFMPVSYRADVEVLKPLGNAVIAYGDTAGAYKSGVDALVPYSNNYANVFGLQQVLNGVGIFGRGCVCGDDRGHFFIGGEGNLWFLGPDLKAQKLGYSNLLSGLSRPLMTLDPIEEKVYIASYAENVGTYVFDIKSGGMSIVQQKIGTIVYLGSNQCAIQEDLSGGENDYFQWTSDIIDMGTRAIKTIVGLEIGGTQTTTGYFKASILYRHNNLSAFTESTVQTATDWGVVPFRVSGAEFQINIEMTDYTKFTNLNYVKVRYAVSDHRQMEGNYTPLQGV